MIIAAFIVFGSLLTAWLLAPPEPRKRPAAPQAGPMQPLTPETLAEAA